MGSFFSSLTNPNPCPEFEDETFSDNFSQIHSSGDWDVRFNELKESDQLMVVDFSASWYGPCRSLEPVFEALASKYPDVCFIKIEVDELQDVAKQYRVEAMPTLVFLKRGKEMDRIVGAKKDELEKKIKNHMK